MNGKEARYVNLALGVWLFISAFLWRHGSAQFTNTWLMGVIAAVVALVATGAPGFRYANTIVGVWLVISAFIFPTVTVGTVWNNVVVGLLLIAVSLVSSRSTTTRLSHPV